MVRPSYVLGGRAMEIVYSDSDLKRYIQNAVEVHLLATCQQRHLTAKFKNKPAGVNSFTNELPSY